MKNKKLFMIAFVALLFTVLMLLNTKKVNAAYIEDINTPGNTIIKVKTTIKQWTKDNALIYSSHGNSDWSTAYLTDGTTVINLNEYQSLNNINSFTEGSTIYLYEEYDFESRIRDNYPGVQEETQEISTVSHESDDKALEIDSNVYWEYGISTGEDFNTLDGLIEFNVPVYLDRVYGSDNPSENGSGNIINYLYAKENDVKKTVLDGGTITLPRFHIKMNLTASGNLLGSGFFSMYGSYGSDPEIPGLSYDSSRWGVSADTSNLHLDEVYASINTALKYRNLANYNLNYKYIEYDGYGSEHEFTARCTQGEHYGFELEDEETNTYKFEITGNVSKGRSVPNGIFYNILPYIVAVALASIGVIILKKHSVKE